MKLEIGMKVGRVTLIGKRPPEWYDKGTRKWAPTIWKCRCECGDIVEKRQDYIRKSLRVNNTVACRSTCPTVMKNVRKALGEKI